MTKPYFISAGLLLMILIIGCKKDGIPSANTLLFEENFEGNYAWNINGETDTSIAEPGEAAGEVTNGKLYLHATGCTKVNASLPFTSLDLLDESYNKMTITIDIEEFTASPIISQSNNIEISFKDFHLSIKPKQNISNLLLVFSFKKGFVELYEETDAIEYTFTTSASNNRCYINLQSQSMANCIASAGLKISAIKIYKK